MSPCFFNVVKFDNKLKNRNLINLIFDKFNEFD